MASSKRDEQLGRITELRRFVGTFARAADRGATAEALAALARASANTGLVDEALKRARQALHLLEEEEPTEGNVRALTQVAAAALGAGDAETANRASLLATERAATLSGALANELGGAAALLAGITCATQGDTVAARKHLDVARDRLVAAQRPDGAALSLTQLGLLDVGAGQLEAAAICFQFARDFYRASDNHAGAADVGSIAARALASEHSARRDAWFREAAADAERAGNRLGAAELILELADHIAAGGDTRRASDVAAHALSHLRMAFAQALGTRTSTDLAGVLEVLVAGLVRQRFGDAGWALLDKFGDELKRWGFHALAASAKEARQVLASEP